MGLTVSFLIILSHIVSSQYILVQSHDISWWQAQSECMRDYGTSLATIISKQQMEQIQFFINSSSSNINAVYIGLNDHNVNGEWGWIDGTNCFLNEQMCTQFWLTPNNIDNGDCGILISNGLIIAIDCIDIASDGYLCNIYNDHSTMNPTPEPTPTCFPTMEPTEDEILETTENDSSDSSDDDSSESEESESMDNMNIDQYNNDNNDFIDDSISNILNVGESENDEIVIKELKTMMIDTWTVIICLLITNICILCICYLKRIKYERNEIKDVEKRDTEISDFTNDIDVIYRIKSNSN